MTPEDIERGPTSGKQQYTITGMTQLANAYQIATMNNMHLAVFFRTKTNLHALKAVLVWEHDKFVIKVGYPTELQSLLLQNPKPYRISNLHYESWKQPKYITFVGEDTIKKGFVHHGHGHKLHKVKSAEDCMHLLQASEQGTWAIFIQKGTGPQQISKILSVDKYGSLIGISFPLTSKENKPAQMAKFLSDIQNSDEFLPCTQNLPHLNTIAITAANWAQASAVWASQSWGMVQQLPTLPL